MSVGGARGDPVVLCNGLVVLCQSVVHEEILWCSAMVWCIVSVAGARGDPVVCCNGLVVLC